MSNERRMMIRWKDDPAEKWIRWIKRAAQLLTVRIAGRVRLGAYVRVW